jgi:hypothetical protein
VVVTSNYGEAGALARYTSLRVYSGHNGYGLWEVPLGSEPALLVGVHPSFCSTSKVVETIRVPVDNDEDGVTLTSCTPRAPWSQMWPQICHVG